MDIRERVWNWLPTFLAVVAEGGLAPASRALHVTPAAVSRTIRLLEAELGEPLFNRVGRTLVLNERGARLSRELRGAVAKVDRGIARSLSTEVSGPLRVASIGVLTDHFVVSTLLAMKTEHPALVPEHHNLPAAQAAQEVGRGMLDVAFYYEDLTVEGVVAQPIASTTMSVYCGKGHPLFDGPQPKTKSVLEHAFSVPQIGDSGRVLDGWPSELPRQIGMRITTLRSNLEVCCSGVLQCVLPDVTADAALRAGQLRRLTSVSLPDIPVYAARSVEEVPGAAADAVVTGVKARIEAFELAD